MVRLKNPFSSPHCHMLTIRLRYAPNRLPTYSRKHHYHSTLPARPCTPPRAQAATGVPSSVHATLPPPHLEPHCRTAAKCEAIARENDPTEVQSTQHEVERPQ
jgi:hypothetical protein